MDDRGARDRPWQEQLQRRGLDGAGAVVLRRRMSRETSIGSAREAAGLRRRDGGLLRRPSSRPCVRGRVTMSG